MRARDGLEPNVGIERARVQHHKRTISSEAPTMNPRTDCPRVKDVIGRDEDGRVAARRQLDFLPDAGWRTLLEHDLTFHVCMSPRLV